MFHPELLKWHSFSFIWLNFCKKTNKTKELCYPIIDQKQCRTALHCIDVKQKQKVLSFSHADFFLAEYASSTTNDQANTNGIQWYWILCSNMFILLFKRHWIIGIFLDISNIA